LCRVGDASLSNSAPEAVAIDSGTSLMLSARFCAVTTISSSPDRVSTDSACAGVAQARMSTALIATPSLSSG
jgi:hypothetical protein